MSDGLHRRPALASFLEEKAVSGRENTGADLEVRPGYGYLNLRGDPGDERFMQAVRETLGQPLPALANTFTAAAPISAPYCTIYWLGPDEWLLATEPGREKTSRHNLAKTWQGNLTPWLT